MARIRCMYCKGTINRSDIKCPNCGAETADSIKANMEEEKKLLENNRKLQETNNKKIALCWIRMIAFFVLFIVLSVIGFKYISKFFIAFLVFLVLLGAYIIYLIMDIKKCGKYYEKGKELYHLEQKFFHMLSFACEDVQLYKMIPESKSSLNEDMFKEGLQQMAFKVRITNDTNHNTKIRIFDDFFASHEECIGSNCHVNLIADGDNMKGCSVNPFFPHHEENNKVFEPALYKDGFYYVNLRPQESLVGWVGFYVNPNAKNLELWLGNECVMLKNPMLDSDNTVKVKKEGN